jgi:flagellar hook-associated protein 3 FlgL
MTSITRLATGAQSLQNMDSVGAMSKRMARLQEQISSGKAIQRASEDPSGTQSVMNLRAEQTRMSQYAQNIDNGLLRLNATRTQVDSINDQLLKAREIVVQGQASNSTASSRSALAAQIDVIASSLLVAANSDFAGRALFTGATSADTAYTALGAYVGDTNAVTTRVDDFGSTVRIELNGPEVFGSGAGNAFAVLTSIASNLRSAPASLSVDLTSLDSVITTARGAQSTVVSRINQLNELRDVTADRILSVTGALAAVEDTDLTKTVMELTMQQTSYEAALYSTAQIMQPSLMDFLR